MKNWKQLQCSVMKDWFNGVRGGWKVQEGGDLCIPMVDSC